MIDPTDKELIDHVIFQCNFDNFIYFGEKIFPMNFWRNFQFWTEFYNNNRDKFPDFVKPNLRFLFQNYFQLMIKDVTDTIHFEFNLSSEGRLKFGFHIERKNLANCFHAKVVETRELVNGLGSFQFSLRINQRGFLYLETDVDVDVASDCFCLLFDCFCKTDCFKLFKEV